MPTEQNLNQNQKFQFELIISNDEPVGGKHRIVEVYLKWHERAREYFRDYFWDFLIKFCFIRGGGGEFFNSMK